MGTNTLDFSPLRDAQAWGLDPTASRSTEFPIRHSATQLIGRYFLEVD